MDISTTLLPVLLLGAAAIAAPNEHYRRTGDDMASILAALATKDRVTVTGFRTFECSKRAARTGKNPKTGKEVCVKAVRSFALIIFFSWTWNLEWFGVTLWR